MEENGWKSTGAVTLQSGTERCAVKMLEAIVKMNLVDWAEKQEHWKNISKGFRRKKMCASLKLFYIYKAASWLNQIKDGKSYVIYV